jgi:hypothetical protein
MADPQQPDAHFFERSNAYIKLANEQSEAAQRGEVTASMMFASARYNVFVAAVSFPTQADLESKKQEIVEYYATQYRAMLEEHIGDYISNFSSYIRPPA